VRSEGPSHCAGDIVQSQISGGGDAKKVPILGGAALLRTGAPTLGLCNGQHCSMHLCIVREITANVSPTRLTRTTKAGREARLKSTQKSALHQNVNANPPRTERADCTRYTVRPSFAITGTYPCAKRFRTSTRASTRPGKNPRHGIGCRRKRFK
jgi:hypothetical protein